MTAQSSSEVPERIHTVEEFLAWEAGQEQRHEWAGRVVVMSGGTDRHDHVAQAVNRRLLDALDDGPCGVFTHNRQLRTMAGAHVRYPDVLARCTPGDDPNRESDADLVVEVLSPSTAETDLGEKLTECGTVSSLRQYLIVDPVREHAFLYQRHDLGWCVTEHGAGQAGVRS